MAGRRKKITDKGELYPWLRLLELEVQPPDRGARPADRRNLPRGRGRPANPFPRKAVHVTLTEDEMTALDELADFLSTRLGKLHRGHLIAFLIFYLRSRLQQGDNLELPPEVVSLSDLASFLDRELVR